MTSSRARHDLADFTAASKEIDCAPPLLSIYSVLHRLELENIPLPVKVPLTCCVDYFFIRAMYVMETRAPRAGEPLFPAPLALVKQPAGYLNSHVLLQEMVDHDWNRRLQRDDLSDDDHPHDVKQEHFNQYQYLEGQKRSVGGDNRVNQKAKDFKVEFRERKKKQKELDDPTTKKLMAALEAARKSSSSGLTGDGESKQGNNNSSKYNRDKDDPLLHVSKNDLARIDYELFLEQERQDYQGKHEEATYNGDNRFRDAEALKFSIWAQVAFFDHESERMNIEYLDSHGIRDILRNASSRKSRCVITQFLPPDDTAPPRNEMVSAVFAGNFFRLERRVNNHDYRDPTFSLNERGSCDASAHSQEIQVPKVMRTKIEDALKDLVQKIEFMTTKRVIVLRVAVKFRRGAVWLLHGDELVFFDRSVPRMSDPSILFAAGSPTQRIELRKRIKIVSRKNYRRANPQSLAQSIIRQMAEARRRERIAVTERRKEQDEAKKQFALKHGFKLTAAGIGSNKTDRSNAAAYLSSERLRDMLKQNRKEQRELRNLGSFYHQQLTSENNTSSAGPMSPTSSSQQNFASFSSIRRRSSLPSFSSSPNRRKDSVVTSTSTSSGGAAVFVGKMTPKKLNQEEENHVMNDQSTVAKTTTSGGTKIISSRRQSSSSAETEQKRKRMAKKTNAENDDDDYQNDEEEDDPEFASSMRVHLGDNFTPQKTKPKVARNLILGDLQDEILKKVNDDEKEGKKNDVAKNNTIKLDDADIVDLISQVESHQSTTNASFFEDSDDDNDDRQKDDDDDKKKSNGFRSVRFISDVGDDDEDFVGDDSAEEKLTREKVNDDDNDSSSSSDDDDEYFLTAAEKRVRRESIKIASLSEEEKRLLSAKNWLRAEEPLLSEDDFAAIELLREEQTGFASKRISQFRARDGLAAPSLLFMKLKLKKAEEWALKMNKMGKTIWELDEIKEKEEKEQMHVKNKKNGGSSGDAAVSSSTIKTTRRKSMMMSDSMMKKSFNLSTSTIDSTSLSASSSPLNKLKKTPTTTTNTTTRAKSSSVSSRQRQEREKKQNRMAESQILRQEQIEDCENDQERFWKYRENILTARVEAAMRRNLLMHLKIGDDEFCY